MRRLSIALAFAAAANSSLQAQTIYPIDRADILAGSCFDLKVEFPGLVGRTSDIEKFVFACHGNRRRLVLFSVGPSCRTMKESTMKQRLNWTGQKNDGLDALLAVEAWLLKTLDHKLLALVKTRASQINGCAFCLHMHSQEARKAGEREERLLLLDAWHESALYTERERAALAWTEALTRIAETHAPDDIYEEVRRSFSDQELAALSIAIAMINAWNRLSIGFRAQHPADVARAA